MADTVAVYANTTTTHTITSKMCLKKCWICLTMVEMDTNEVLILKDFFLAKNLYNIDNNNNNNRNPKAKNKENYVQLKLLFNRIILSACKCRKKLAHEVCFNNYIDIKQNGNVTNQISCPQCNLKYEFCYPYDGIVLHIFDFLDQVLNLTSTATAVGALFISAYWCSLSYGLLTMLQIYGNEHGAQIVKNSNVLVTVILLPVIPIFLVLCRFIPLENAINKFFPSCFNNTTNVYRNKYQRHQDQIYYADDDEEENLKITKRIRRVVGGLALPTIAIVFDQVIFSFLCRSNESSLWRTAMVGLAFVGIKGISKVVYIHKKLWEEENKSIQDYKSKQDS